MDLFPSLLPSGPRVRTLSTTGLSSYGARILICFDDDTLDVTSPLVVASTIVPPKSSLTGNVEGMSDSV